jgi:hypothetical protein
LISTTGEHKQKGVSSKKHNAFQLLPNFQGSQRLGPASPSRNDDDYKKQVEEVRRSKRIIGKKGKGKLVVKRMMKRGCTGRSKLVWRRIGGSVGLD